MRPNASLDDCGQCLLFAAIQGMEDGCVLVNRRGTVFHMNRSAQELLALGGRRVVGQPFRALLPDAALVAFVAAGIRGDGPTVLEQPLASGGRLVRATLSRCTGNGGEPLGHVLLLRDVTRERRVQVELSSAVARKLVDMAGGDAPEPSGVALTRRERETLGLLAEGHTNAAIAAQMSVSANTVSSHVKRLYAKLGVHNRAQAAAWALRHR